MLPCCIGLHVFACACLPACLHMDQFSVGAIIRSPSCLKEDEAAVEPTPANMVEWLGRHFDAGEVEAEVGAGGRLQLVAEHHWGSYAIKIRWGQAAWCSFFQERKVVQLFGLICGMPHVSLLGDTEPCPTLPCADQRLMSAPPIQTGRLPPGEPMEPLQDTKRAAWVVQEMLFTQAAWGRMLARRLDACQQRCPLEQQFEDLLAFLAAGGGGQAGAAAAAAAAGAAAAAIDSSEGDGDSGRKAENGKAGCSGGSPVAPRAAHIISKRKLQELEAAATAAAAGGPPASGSAVKAPRPGTQAAGPGAGAQPASTQQTGGASNATQRSDMSEIGKPKVTHRPKPGRGRGATQIGRARR